MQRRERSRVAVDRAARRIVGVVVGVVAVARVSAVEELGGFFEPRECSRFVPMVKEGDVVRRAVYGVEPSRRG